MESFTSVMPRGAAGLTDPRCRVRLVTFRWLSSPAVALVEFLCAVVTLGQLSVTAGRGAARLAHKHRALQWPLVFLWRWSTGKPLRDGIPRTDAGWFTEGTRELDRDSAPRPPKTIGAEIRQDVRQFIVELRELRARRAARP